MKYLKLTTAMLAALSISACSGSGGGGTVDTPVVDVPATFAEKKAYAEGLGNLYNDDQNGLTEGFNIPTEGSASYDGVMAFPDPSGKEGQIMGDFDVAVDFSEATVLGSAGNFTNSINDAWAGDLAIDGTLVGFDVDGELESEAGVVTVISASSFAEWGLRGVDDGNGAPQYIGGLLEGEMTTGDDDAVGWETFDAGYIGEINP